MTQLTKEPEKTQEAGLTDEQLRRLEDEAGLEYVDGQFEEKTNVSRDSSRAVMKIGKLLGAAEGDPPIVEIFAQDLAYRCHPEKPDWIRKPDVSLIRKERLSELGNVGMMPIPADLAIEVLSPNDLARDVNRKVEEYLAAGFNLIWVVSPEERMVDVYQADGGVARLRANDSITAEAVLPEFHCQVADFFG